MRPLIKAAVAAALLASLGEPQAPPPNYRAPAPAPVPLRSARPGERLCGAGALPVGPDGACVKLAATDGHTASRQRRITEDRRRPLRLGLRAGDDAIALQPGRSIDWHNYQLPIMPHDHASWHGDERRAGGGEGSYLSIEAAAGSEVRLVALDGQLGAARVLLVGQLYGVTVAVRHTLPSTVPGSPRQRHIIALYSQLGKPGPQVVTGARLEEGDVIGHLTRAAGGGAQLRFQLREERSDSSGITLLSRLVLPTISIPTDPRNVLAPRHP